MRTYRALLLHAQHNSESVNYLPSCHVAGCCEREPEARHVQVSERQECQQQGAWGAQTGVTFEYKQNESIPNDGQDTCKVLTNICLH